MSYSAIVCRVKSVRPHPNADRLRLASAAGFQVIVGLETNEGTLGVFFPTDGRLSPAFLTANDLVRRIDPETGEKVGGLFDDNGRVRAQKLRGEISEGFWCGMDYLLRTPGLKLTTVSALGLGDEFASLDGVAICEKYVTRATKRNTNMPKGTGSLKRKNPRFPEHMDTRQFRADAEKIPHNSIIYLTEKLHGTSARYAYVLDELPLTRWQRIKKRLGFRVKPQMGYVYSVGTRRCELRPDKADSFYGGDFRHNVMKDSMHLLRKGEVVYGEIVGWTDTGASIMPAPATKCLKDKAFTKTYGDQMQYKYGCPSGTCKFYVYRIAQTNDDGILTELSWPQTKKRAGELGLLCVPDFAGPLVFAQGSGDSLREVVSVLTNGSSLLDSSHIREGVCVRVESQNPLVILKEKSFVFRQLEDGAKTNDETVDMEEQQEFLGE